MKAIATTGFCILLFTSIAAAQDLPSNIRGYKLYNTKMLVVDGTKTVKPDESHIALKLGETNIVDIGFSGATAEVGAEITSVGRSGKVDFVTFRDFTVNGIALDIEEYNQPFEFKKGLSVTLPKPARVNVKTTSLAKGALKQLTDPKEDWAVKGTILVFGRFKKFGFTFKRVVPVKVDLTIKNPLK